MALNHVALTVRGRERSAAFYGEHFELVERVHDDDHLLILASADVREAECEEANPTRVQVFGPDGHRVEVYPF